jgi:hypothetical protein
LYIARRRDPENGGLGPVTLETMLGCPQQHLEFPIWYLKKRGFVERMGNGYVAITAEGIDKLGSGDLSLPAGRLIADKTTETTPESKASFLLEEATAT